MNIKEKNEENDFDSNVSELSSLTRNKSIKSSQKTKLNKRILLLLIFILISSILIVFLFFAYKQKQKLYISISNYYNITLYNCKIMKNISKIYSDKWIVLTTDKNPSFHISKLISVPEPWKIVVVEKGKIFNNFWYNYISDKLIYLSLEDQMNLCFQTVNYIPVGSYARKNIGYLYAMKHGAKEIFDIDEDFNFKDKNLLIRNISNLRLYYANNNSQMINPYYYFGRPDIWPRGFRLKDISKNNTNTIFSAMENQYVCKPLIIQGITRKPDFDSIFLNTRKGNVLKGHNYIELHSINPLLYLPGNYIPVNSKNTIILYDVFPAMALPTTVTREVSDIWRGYLMQRYGWGYGGVVMYKRGGVLYDWKYENQSLDFEREKDLYYKLDSLLEILNGKIDSDMNITHPVLFFMKLIEILVEKNILKENDLNMYKAFIYDIESFGYTYNISYKINIDSNTNIKNYLIISTELQYHLPTIPAIYLYHNNKNMKLLKHYTIKNKYNDIVLIINYNYEFLIKLNSFITELYQEYFPKIVFIYPNSNYTGNDNNVIMCPESHKGYYSYYCIQKVYDKYPKMKGYLFAMDDVFIKVWELENYDFDIPWIMTFYVSKTKNWPKSNDREEEMLNKNKKWQNNLRKFYKSKIIGHGISDFFYLPNYFVKDYMIVARELFIYRVFLELAVPSIYGILLREKYQYVQFSGLWDDDRKNWFRYLRNAHRQTVIHPIKLSDIKSQIIVTNYLYFKKAEEY